jgi:predicted nucleic-acid-binding Zn-ribbon protein
MARKRKAVTARFGADGIQCVICKNGQFWTREIKLNTSGMEFLDLGWANQSAQGLICTACGYVHEFLGDAITLYEAPAVT